MQVDPRLIRVDLTALVSAIIIKLKYGEQLSIFAFNISVRTGTL